MASNLLSKSTYIKSLQCPKALYLHKKHRYLRDEVTAQQQATFNRGHSIGALAQELFPGGRDVGWESPLAYQSALRRTAKALAEGVRVLYEAAFMWNNILVAVDILVQDRNTGRWALHEVKSTLGASSTHIRDAALQYHVLTLAGLEVDRVYVTHLNRGYVRGDRLDIHALFTHTEVTSEVVAMQGTIEANIIKAFDILSLPEIPAISIGPHCDDPYPCDFKGYCWGLREVNLRCSTSMRLMWTLDGSYTTLE